MKILKFGAVWCRECLVMRPLWEEIEKEIPELVTEYYDVDDDPGKVKEYNANYAPLFIFLDKEGREILRLRGAQSKDDLMRVIKENLHT
jgi:hypothetical protein